MEDLDLDERQVAALEEMGFNRIFLRTSVRTFLKELLQGAIEALIVSFFIYVFSTYTFRECFKYSLMIIWGAEFIVFPVLFYFKRKQWLNYSKKFKVKQISLFFYTVDGTIKFKDLKKMTPEKFAEIIEEEEALKKKFPNTVYRKIMRATIRGIKEHKR